MESQEFVGHLAHSPILVLPDRILEEHAALVGKKKTINLFLVTNKCFLVSFTERFSVCGSYIKAGNRFKVWKTSSEIEGSG